MARNEQLIRQHKILQILERYRFGPAEWLWRSLTYMKKQPMR